MLRGIKITKKIIVIATVSLLLCGCVSAEVTYTVIAITENPVGTKTATVTQNEGGIREAAQKAGITRIGTVVEKLTKKIFHNYFNGIDTSYSHTYETIITGE
ncbi:hypothetical protein FACS1894200_09730 [Spirochaetia bacterium]|nr:hypothetical protein FACS1894200_09730 [Spirochaetia bacterium]